MFHWVRKFGIFLVGVTLPIQGYALRVGPIPMTATRIVAAFLLALGMVQFLLTGRRWPRNSKNPWVLAFLVSFVIACVSGLLIHAPIEHVLTLTGTFVSLVIYYFLVTYVVLNRNDLALLLWALVLGSVITAAPAILGFEVGQELGEAERFQGLSGQTNLFGYDMAVALPVTVGLLFAGRSLFWKAILAGVATITVVAILLSLSRSGFVSLAAMLVFWVYRSGRVGSIKYVIPAALVLVGIVYAAPESVTQRIQTMTDRSERGRDLSIQSRFVVGKFAIKAFLHHPLTGAGRFGFNHWAAKQKGGWMVGESTIHSAYLGVAAYQGLLGLIPFGMMLVLTWRDYSRVRLLAAKYRGHRDPILSEYGHHAVFLQIAFLGNLVGNLFGTSLNSKSQWLVISLSTVLVALASSRTREIGAQATAPEAGSGRLGATAFGVAAGPVDAGFPR